MGKIEKKHLTKKSENVADWYTEVVLKSELADYGPAKGTMVIRPYGYALWEAVRLELDSRFREQGVENAYFPLFIPQRLLNREKDHVEGFSPEVAVVTHAGGKKLEEPLVVRPTSETVMYEMFAKWIHSWRDLPLKINQWANVVRWELRTHLFLRTSEFLWQEGHTVHATAEEAQRQVMDALVNYREFYRNFFAIAGIEGRKSESEKFAGADTTYTYEMLMPDGKALQGCTSHELGQRFAKAFNIRFLDEKGESRYPWQTSWGFSTRSIGALILAHGDDQGLVLPPRVAPCQLVVVPIPKAEQDMAGILEFIRETLKDVRDIRYRIDEREGYSPGWKFHEWELRGVPIRMEVGPSEMNARSVSLVVRDTGARELVAVKDLPRVLPEMLDAMQKRLLEKSESFLRGHTSDVSSYDEFKSVLREKHGMIRALWCENEACERKIKEETKATTRALPLDAKEEKGFCIVCNAPASHAWIFAQAY